jgi:UDP-glucuronate 4-epimerase
MQPGDVPESFADIDRSIKKINYNPKIDIENGIPLFIDWYKTYHSS